METLRANLIIRPEKIGDLVVSTPVIRAFKETYPAQPLHLLTDPISAELVRHDPHLDKIIVIEWKGRSRGQHAAWLDIYGLLKSQPYSRAAILYANCSGWNWLCSALGIRHVAQIGGTWPAVILRHKMILRHFFKTPKHVVEFYLDVARLLGCSVNSQETRLYVLEEEKQLFIRKFPEYVSARRRILIHPFFVTSGANWNRSTYQVLGLRLSNQYNTPVFIVGAEDDIPKWQEYSHESLDTSLLGMLSIRELLVALDMADIVIGGASGVGHLAAAMGLPVVSLYCPNHNHHLVWKPYGTSAICLVPDKDDCVMNVRCPMNHRGKGICDLSFGISVDSVLTSVNNLLDNICTVNEDPCCAPRSYR